MREIIQKSISSGVEGVRLPGKHTLPKEVAAELVKGGHAEYADANPTPQQARPPKGNK